MQLYRTAFFITLTTTAPLAGVAVFMWFHPRGAAGHVPAASNPAAAPVSSPPSGAAPSPESSAEPKVVPVTLTPERMQTIGVKTGTVEYRQVHDEIRTTGNVEVDETRLTDGQVRFAGWVQKVYADATFKQVRKHQPMLTIY